jgi:hypothetical protein
MHNPCPIVVGIVDKNQFALNGSNDFAWRLSLYITSPKVFLCNGSVLKLFYISASHLDETSIKEDYDNIDYYTAQHVSQFTVFGAKIKIYHADYPAKKSQV